MIVAILLLLPVVQLTSSPARAASYKLGPVFHTSAGHTVTIEYDLPISEQQVQIANGFLNQYVPQLLKIFWEPPRDIIVPITEVGCGSSSCAGTDGMSILPSDWNIGAIWAHEFTHILQFMAFGPGFALSGDSFLYYAETAAMATQSILAPLTPEPDCCSDLSFMTKDQGVGRAIYDYMLQHGGETHIPTHVWTLLFKADQNIFKEVNQHLYQLVQQGLYFSDLSSFRELIHESTPVQVINNLPIKQWLAVEGFLGKNEVGTNPITFISSPFFFAIDSLEQIAQVAADVVTVNGELALDHTQSHATLYDALTKSKIADLPIQPNQGGGQSVVFQSYTGLQSLPSIVRFDLHLVGSGFTDDRSILAPFYQNQGGNPALGGNALIIIPTSDMWLQNVNGNINAENQTYPITNGAGVFNVNGVKTVSVSVGPMHQIVNFLQGEAFPVGINYTALSTMQDTNTIVPQGGTITNTISTTSITIVDTTSTTSQSTTSTSYSSSSLTTVTSSTVIVSSSSTQSSSSSTSIVSTSSTSSTTSVLSTTSSTQTTSTSTLSTTSSSSSQTLVSSSQTNVTIPITPPDFMITPAMNTVLVPQSSSVKLVVSVDPVGQFNQPVNLSVDNVPSGIQISFSPNPVKPTPGGVATSTATFIVSRSVSTGNYAIRISATNGTKVKEATITLQVSGCLIATATFGSELAPEVQFLRDFRDYKILQTFAGSSFMTAFNEWYYSFSPSVAQYEYQHPIMQSTMKILLYPLIGILKMGAYIFDLLPIGGEAGAILSGMTISALLGIVYLSLPLTAILRLLSKRTQQRMKTLENMSHWALLAALIVTILADLAGLGTALMAASVILVLTTVTITALWTSRYLRAILQR